MPRPTVRHPPVAAAVAAARTVAASLAVVGLLAGAWRDRGRTCSAHDGAGAAFTGEAGPYTLYAYDGTPRRGAGRAGLHRDRCSRTADGAPVDGATVTVTAAPRGHHRDAAAAGQPPPAVANVYAVPAARPGRRAAGRSGVAVDGAAGTGGTAPSTLHGRRARPGGLARTAPGRPPGRGGGRGAPGRRGRGARRATPQSPAVPRRRARDTVTATRRATALAVAALVLLTGCAGTGGSTGSVRPAPAATAAGFAGFPLTVPVAVPRRDPHRHQRRGRSPAGRGTGAG